MESQLITPAEVAEFLRLPTNRIYVLVREGILPACKIGRQIRFSPKAIEEFVENGGQGYR